MNNSSDHNQQPCHKKKEKKKRELNPNVTRASKQLQVQETNKNNAEHEIILVKL